MANPAAPNNAEKNAQKFFKKAEQSDTLAKRSRKKERSDHATKTAKLRELRLAKETVDKAEADKQAAAKSEAMTDAQREKQRKRAAIVETEKRRTTLHGPITPCFTSRRKRFIWGMASPFLPHQMRLSATSFQKFSSETRQ